MNSPTARGPCYRQLPLWRDAQRRLLEGEQAVRAFPRDHSYALGTELRRQAMEVNRWVERAAQENNSVRRIARAQGALPTCLSAVCIQTTVVHPQRSSLSRICLLSAANLPALKRCLVCAGQAWCEAAEQCFLRGGLKCRPLRAVWPATSAPSLPAAATPIPRRALAGLAKPTEAQP